MRNLILFGFKSCGKTHLGKLLAHKLNWSFIDTDQLLVDLYQEKSSPFEIHQALGEFQFRKLENLAIQTIRPKSPTIIALGGGSLLDIDNLAHLKSIGKLVYLKSDFSTISKRILKERIPSFVDENTPLDSVYKKRVGLYESIEAPCVDIHLLNEKEALKKLHEIAVQEEQVSQYGF
jgi:shikimate kinase